jgi:drug/metabolite transporter (DMT)-like permease
MLKMGSMRIHPATAAIAAALLFGASTPLAKLLVGAMPPLLLAGLLYLGSGVGLGALLLVRRALRRTQSGESGPWSIPRRDAPWLLGAIIAGGIAGPALLMAGLRQTNAASAALLLNLEGVFTALLAWLVFRESTDRGIVLGMIAIVAGGVLLSWPAVGTPAAPGALLIAAACLSWAIDNNLTRKVSSHDAMLVAGCKGVVAGLCNTSLALAAGAALPSAGVIRSALLLGFVGYGVSLALFVVALRRLGTSRTAAYFSIAPLFGVMLAFALWPEAPGAAFWAAATLMALGLGLHLRERHQHPHTHAPLAHGHSHAHDAHHRHEHDFAWDGREPHAHPHAHAARTHEHAHFPDIHHRHPH